MDEPRYPLTVALPGSPVRHNARTIGTGYLVTTRCGQPPAAPSGDGGDLPGCGDCAALTDYPGAAGGDA